MPDFKIFDWLLGAISSLLGLLYLHNNKRLDKLERNHENNERFQKIEEICEALSRQVPSDFERVELARQRIATASDITRIFNVLDEMKERATTRHLELLGRINEKADRA